MEIIPIPPPFRNTSCPHPHSTQVSVSKPFQVTIPPFFLWPIQVPQLPSRTANWRDHVQLTDQPRNRKPIPRLTLHPPIPPRPFQIVSALNGDTTTSSRGTGGPSCTGIFWRSAAAVRLVGFRVRQGLGRSRSPSSEEGPRRSAGERNAGVAALMVPPDGEEEE